MGFIRENFGKISVESRRESFYVHAGYGYSVGKSRVGDLKPGDDFLADGRIWRLRALMEDRVEAEESQFSTRKPFALDHIVEVPGTEEFDENDSLGSLWRKYPHPEFANEDLNDLIAALEDYRESL